MLVDKRHALWKRALFALPPLVLVFFLLTIYFTFVWDVLYSLLATQFETRGLVFRAPLATRVLLGFVFVLIHALLVPLLLSFGRVVFTKARGVPTWYTDAHMAAVRFFTQTENAYAGLGQPQTPAQSYGPRLRGMVGGELVENGTTGAESHDAEAPPSPKDSEAGVELAEQERGDGLRPTLQRGRGSRSLVPTSTEINYDALSNPGPHDVRWCRKCRNVKPPRAHHCTICGECVLKMDHHCPWVGNCVGFGNYKFFYLLLFWGLCNLLLVNVVWLPMFFKLWLPLQLVGNESATTARALIIANLPYGIEGGIASRMFGGILALSLGISMCLFVSMHTGLILKGQTTLEANLFGIHAYHFGFRRNWELVMGHKKRWWFWPILTPDVELATRYGTEFQRCIGDEMEVITVAVRDSGQDDGVEGVETTNLIVR